MQKRDYWKKIKQAKQAKRDAELAARQVAVAPDVQALPGTCAETIRRDASPVNRHTASTSISSRSQVESDIDDGAKVTERDPLSLDLLKQQCAHGESSDDAKLHDAALVSIDKHPSKTKKGKRNKKAAQSTLRHAHHGTDELQDKTAALSITHDDSADDDLAKIRVRVPGSSTAFAKPAPVLMSEDDVVAPAKQARPRVKLDRRTNSSTAHTLAQPQGKSTDASRSASAPQLARSGTSSVVSALTPVPSIAEHDLQALASPTGGMTPPQVPAAFDKMRYAQAPVFVPAYSYAVPPAPVFYDPNGYPIYGYSPYVPGASMFTAGQMPLHDPTMYQQSAGQLAYDELPPQQYQQYPQHAYNPYYTNMHYHHDQAFGG